MHALIYTFYLKSNGKNPYFGQKDIKPFFNFISLAKTLHGSFISKIILKTLGTIWRIFLLCHWYSCNFLEKKIQNILNQVYDCLFAPFWLWLGDSKLLLHSKSIYFCWNDNTMFDSKSQFDLWKLKAYDWYGFYTFCSITWLGILNTMNFTTKNLPLPKITDYNASSKNKNVSSKSLSYLRCHNYSNLNSVKVSFYTKKVKSD